MKIGSLFSGYGGLELGIINATGGEVVWHCEFDKAPSKILETRFPGIPNFGDVTKVDWSAVEPVDVLCGGFPCQDVSLAGKRAGMKNGTRSGLWAHFATAIETIRPRLVVIENVRGLLSADAASEVEPCAWCMGKDDAEHSLRALGAVLGTLADIGYDAEWVTVPASAAGAPHRRERVFIIAYPPRLPTPTVSDQYTDNLASSQQSDGSLHSVTLAQIVNRPDLLPTPTAQAAKHGSTPDINANSFGHNLWDLPTLLPTPMASMKGASKSEIDKGNPRARLEVEVFLPDTWGKFAPAIHRWETITGNPAPAPTIPDGRDGQHRLNPAFAEWMMGLQPGWITDVDITRNEQLKACGNGVVPQQATLALQELMKGTDYVS